tara:strand:+ start:292 stop:498 length:207 start_codon:yes stop_codon:yes gene_type:complete
MKRKRRTSKRFDKPLKTLEENEEFINSLSNEDTNVSYIEVEGEHLLIKGKKFKKPYWWKKLDEKFNIK